MIIDSGSPENIVSKKLVATLNLQAEPHPNPYKVNWIAKKGKTAIKEICMVPCPLGICIKIKLFVMSSKWMCAIFFRVGRGNTTKELFIMGEKKGGPPSSW